MKKNTLITLAAVFVVALLLIVLTRNGVENTKSDAALQPEPRMPVGEEIPILGQEHISGGADITYNSNPPTSGNHWPEPAELGVYTVELPDEQLVHNLEHGVIWISYRNLDIEDIEKLRAVAFKYPEAVILTPRASNQKPIALASWGRLQEMENVESSAIENFVLSNANNSPEPVARLPNTVDAPDVPEVGDTFPNFDLVEVNGSALSLETLKGKPAIIWFTTSWCIPCQIGARKTSALDTELGGDAFDVLVVFVDPTEGNGDLINWRNTFANPDWMVAFDDFGYGLAEELALKFLDTKYLLDENGVIVNIDERQVNEAYIDIIRKVVGN